MPVPAQEDLTVICGRDFYLSVTSQTDLLNPIDLTGYIIYMTVKKNINDPDGNALFSQQPWSEELPLGKFTFKIAHGTTGSWWTPTGPISTSVVYGISFADTASPKNWTTIMTGAINLVQPVLQIIPGG